MRFAVLAPVLVGVLFAAMVSTEAVAARAYGVTKAVPLGAPDRWDYVVFDAASERVYVAHGDQLAVVDARTGEVVGKVEGIAGGAHGTGISPATGQGFTDDGRNGQAVVFDLKTLAVTHRIAADKDADAIAFEPATGHVFVVEGDPAAVQMIDPKTDTIVATIKVGEKLEYATAGEDGVVYVAGEEMRDLVKIDARANAVVARWPTPDCTSPHGLAFDKSGRRLFMSCVNSLMVVVDSGSGRVVAELPIGKGSDAAAFDPVRRRAFSSNGADGTITVYQQVSPDSYTALDTIPTAVSGRTMAVDPVSGRLFVAVADTDPSPTPGGRPKPRPGTLKLLFLDPVN